MNKKLSSLICAALIIIISIPVISIAFARKPDKGPLEKIVFIHHRKDYVKPPWAGGPGGPGEEEEGYYKLLGAKWKKTPVDYVIDPDNPYGLTPDFITGAIFASAEEWDSWTSTDLFGSYTVNPASWDGWEDSVRDDRNELVFGNYPDPDNEVIAVAVVWGYFRGASGKGEIVEFDILFDTDFTWGNVTENLGVMDLQNIATHELGHGVGLADLYATAAIKETMYGYSHYGDIEKRDLYFGDIAGIQELYGPLLGE